MAKCNSDFAPFSRKKKKQTFDFKNRRQKFDYLLFYVRVNMDLNLSVLSSVFGIGGDVCMLHIFAESCMSV